MGESQNAAKTEKLPGEARPSVVEPANTLIAPITAIENSSDNATPDPNSGNTVPIESSGSFAQTGVYTPSPDAPTVPIEPGDPLANQAADRTLDLSGTAPARRDGRVDSIKGYQIVSELGRGGMGVVYRARQTALNRTVALKMILSGAHAGPDQLARFRAEAEAVAQLQHPNIVQVYDIGEQDGLPFFSLEFVDGTTLEKELAGKPQPPASAAQMIETLARAMHYAHERSIIHRDLKPGNILLTKSGAPKISDFGLAKQLESDSSKTRTGTIMGTPSYMAPEQGRGEKQVNHLADVYALGSMLYEMICGRPPFMAPTALQTLMRLLKEEPVPPSRLQPGVSRDLETICMKCLQKDPRRRYDSAGELADDLRRFQAGEPILARPVGRPERAWRWCKRNPRIAALSGAVAVLVVAVAATLSVMGLRMARDRAAVAESRKQAEQRLEQAGGAAASGGFTRAQDLLRWYDPILMSTAELSDVRGRLDELRAQIAAFAEFRKRLDSARYLVLFGSESTRPEAQKACRELIALYDQIEKREGAGRHGWPPLDDHQNVLLQEDIFEAFIVASQGEQGAFLAPGSESERAAATRQAIDWLNRAERLLPPTKALFVQRSNYYKNLGDVEAEQADLDRAKAIEPTSAVDRFWHAFADYLRAEQALQKGDRPAAGNFYRLAATGFAKVVEVRPENFWAHFSWATCLPRLGDGYGAIVGFTNSIQIRPDVPWPYNNRGTVHFQLRELDLAIKDFDKAVELSPGDATGYLRRGAYYFALKEYAKARENFSAAVKIQPADIEAYRNRAVVSLLGKDLDGALADWQELAKLLPASHEPHYYIGTIHLGRQMYEPALAELETAIKLKADDVQSLLARAMIHRWQGKTDDALSDINLVVNKLAPNRADYLIERADLFRALGRDAESLEDYQQCVTLQPKQTDGYLGMASIYERQGKDVLARECFERMIKADPAAASGYLQRAEFLRSHGEFDEAEADCAQAAKAEPKSLLPELVRAGTTAARGDPAQAVKVAEALLEKAPPHDGKILYAAASVFSLAAQTANKDQTDRPESAAQVREYAERGAQLLAEVVGICFHDLQYPEHNRMAWDPALEAIRNLPQVEKLLAGRK